MILQSGNKVAICAGEKKITYNELIQKIHLYSEKLKNQQGRVLIFSENREAWICAFFAAWNTQMIPVPVDFLSVSEDVAYIINDCNPSVIFCSSSGKPIIEEALQKSLLTPEIVIFDCFEKEETHHLPTSIGINPDPDRTAVIIYTSGTTGKAKGVMLSFANLQANIDSVCKEINIFMPEDSVLMLLPLHHILPLLGTLIIPLTVGCTVAISPSMAPEDIIKTIDQNKISIIIGVPRLYAAIRKGIMDKIAKSGIARLLFELAKKANSMKFSRFIFYSVHKKFGGNIKYMVSGGAALDTAVAADFRTLGFELLEGYGLTEAAPMISFTHPGKVKIGSPGFILSCVRARIQNGEIVVSGPNIMQGYYGKAQETAEVLKNGWLHTGDLGDIDKEGYLYITGRKKEIIILSNGKNINPAEIEEKIESTSPVIKEAAVYQENDRIKAIVVLNKQKATELNIEDIDKYLQTLLLEYNQSAASYKMIVQMSITDTELPRTRLGKLQRYLLPSLVGEKKQDQSNQQEIKLEEYHLLKKYLEEEKKIEVLPQHHIIMNLALDSLDRVSLQVFIETTFGISIEMGQLTSFDNILKLSEYIHEHKKHTFLEKINWNHILKQKIHLKLPATWVTSNIIVKISHLFFTLFFRFSTKGSKNIPKEPCIIVANHQSFLDALFVASNLKFGQMQKTFFYAKEKHIRNPFLKYFANRNNIIIMDLNHNLKESIQKMAEVLKRRKNLIIFPEGTRTSDGSLGDFKKTFAILSRELNVPIVPVSINGAFHAMPRGRIFPRPFKKIEVEFMQPVYPENHSYESLSEKVKTIIQRKLKQ